MLISFSGLRGAGKTTIARELARQLGAVHLSIDTIEQAVRSNIADEGDRYRAAYRAAIELAGDNLRLGRTVTTDCVNPITVARNAWRDIALDEGVALAEVLGRGGVTRPVDNSRGRENAPLAAGCQLV